MPKIDTKFWKHEDIEWYKEKIIALMWAYFIFISINVIVYINTGNWVMTALNGLLCLVTLLVYRSFTKYQAEVYTNGKERETIEKEEDSDKGDRDRRDKGQEVQVNEELQHKDSTEERRD